MTNRFIEKLNGFSRLTPAEIEVLAAATAGPHHYAAKHDLIREGDRPGPVFIVLEGWVCRYKILPDGERQGERPREPFGREDPLIRPSGRCSRP